MIRIFLADDHPMIQTALEALLDGTGRKVTGRATSGGEALELIGNAGVDVIILDVQMPGGSGIHVLRELRKRGDDRPVILLTAAIDDEALRQALALRANGIILKSSDPALLIECIDRVAKGEDWIDQPIRERIGGEQGRDRTLSDRECEVIRLVQQGFKNRDIAARLQITEGTVKVYLHRIFEKIGVNSRTELAIKADQLVGRSSYS
jgi:two-component system nitrate/nitrite response regulator NarP